MIDNLIASLARRQHGYVTRPQLLEAGLGVKAIEYRVKAGRLIPIYAGVYAVGHVPTAPADRAYAAVLVCGAGSVLSHSSALALWGWGGELRPPFEVTAPTDHRRRGIRVHRSTSLGRRDVRTFNGIPVTSPARTLLDVAPRLAPKARRRVVREARLSKQLRLDALADVVGRFERHPGARLLLPFVTAPTGPTRSEFEDAFVAFCERYDLPKPNVNVKVLVGTPWLGLAEMAAAA